MKKNISFKIILFLFILVFGYIYYYITLPAINIHSPELWGFIIVLSAIISLILAIYSIKNKYVKESVENIKIKKLIKSSRIFSTSLMITFLLIIIYAIGSFLSSEIINAKKYSELINIENGDFNSDIEQISYNEIPLLDKSSAEIIGARKMGTMVEYVSQFEVASDYTQINYKGKPVRITPLEYGNVLKWFTNRNDGIPAYMLIDMATQDTECIKLKEGIKYSKSEHFGRLIYRYLRFKYPTYIFDTINMEIDDNGIPYWICPVKDYTIGLFGGETISKAVIVNATNGDTVEYDVKDVPEWVDHVFSADLLISYYDYYGTLQNGYFNSILSQKNCMQTTAGYNYIAEDDDVWVYTGITSVGGDQSNVGFVLMNQRTGLTRYYQIPGAEEYSAMDSAKGKVQNLRYDSTFPLLLNISGEPTYFMSLKDSVGLVKMYAMVNIKKYTLVATANTVEECEKNYLSMLKSNNIDVKTKEPVYDNYKEVSGVISKIAQTVIDGNSHYYIVLNGSDQIYDIDVSKYVGIILYNEGSTITMKFVEPSSESEENLTSKQLKTIISIE